MRLEHYFDSLVTACTKLQWPVIFLHVKKPHGHTPPPSPPTYIYILMMSQCGEISQTILMEGRRGDLYLIWRAITKCLFYQFHLEKTSTANMALPGKLMY